MRYASRWRSRSRRVVEAAVTRVPSHAQHDPCHPRASPRGAGKVFDDQFLEARDVRSIWLDAEYPR